MSDVSQGEGWWIASDGKWYPPEATPQYPTPSEEFDQTPAVDSEQAMISPVGDARPKTPRLSRRGALIAGLVTLIVIAGVVTGILVVSCRYLRPCSHKA